MEAKPRAATPGLTVLAGAVLGLAMLFLLRRYPGIYHDSILYLGQGLMQRWPDIYGQDLFFLHGSQASYTIVPWLLGKAFGLASPPAVFMWGTLASMLGFAAASWFCLCAMLPERQRYWAWLGALCLPSIYGMVHIFSYNEPFLTSRPFAETFSLVAIGLLIRRRNLLGIASLAVAGVFHPLQAISATFVIWPWLAMRDRRWLQAAWLALPLAGLALGGVAPFDGLFQRADPKWYAELRDSPQIFVTLWDINDFKVLGFDVLVLAHAWRTLGNGFGRWCVAALIGVVGAILASLLLVDALQLVLPSGLQLWRAHWLAHWFSIAAIAALLFHHTMSRQPVLGMLLALAALLAWGETAWGWLPVTAMYLAWPLVAPETQARLGRILTWLFALAIALLLANHATNEFHWFKEARYRLDLYPVDSTILAFPGLALGIPLVATYLWHTASRGTRRIMFVIVLVPASILVAYAWDSRVPLQRSVEASAYHPDVFGLTIPVGSQVFWEPQSLVSIWMVLQRPSYFSAGQLAGQMFNRETMEEGKRREARLLPLLRESMACQDNALPLDVRKSCRISDGALLRACEPGRDQGPDFVVLPYLQSQVAAGEWVVKDPLSSETVVTYRIYRCREIVPQVSPAITQGRTGSPATRLAATPIRLPQH